MPGFACEAVSVTSPQELLGTGGKCCNGPVYTITLGKGTCKQAAATGHLEILQWARQNNCPWNESTCKQTAANGSLKILQWAHQNKLPLEQKNCHSCRQQWPSRSSAMAYLCSAIVLSIGVITPNLVELAKRTETKLAADEIQFPYFLSLESILLLSLARNPSLSQHAPHPSIKMSKCSPAIPAV